MSARILVCISWLAILFSTAPAWAFFDDLCYSSGNQVGNCLEAQGACSVNATMQSEFPYLSVHSQSSTCLSNLNTSFSDNASNAGSRSMVHADAINLITQDVISEANTLGIKSIGATEMASIAFFMAAYGDAPDHAFTLEVIQSGAGTYTFTPDTDSSRQVIQVSGLYRSNKTDGGTLFHYPQTSAPTQNYNSVDPSSPFEGLSRLRQWVFSLGSRSALAPCVANLGSDLMSTPNAFFTGSSCFTGALDYTYDEGSSAQKIVVTSGPQPVQTSPTADLTYVNLTNLLTASTGMIQVCPNSSYTVPTKLAAMGFYLHSLLDRVSHAECIQNSTLGPANNGNGYAIVEATQPLGPCAPATHAYGHFLEVGAGVPSQSTAYALQLAYRELETYYGVPSASQRTDAYVQNLVSQISQVLSKTNACQRLVAMVNLTTSLDYTPLPGQPSNASLCPTGNINVSIVK